MFKSSFTIAMLIATTASAGTLQQDFDSLCSSKAVKSEKLAASCAAKTMPQPIKDGKRFKNVGIGAEANALIANLTFFK